MSTPKYGNRGIKGNDRPAKGYNQKMQEWEYSKKKGPTNKPHTKHSANLRRHPDCPGCKALNAAQKAKH